MNLRGLANRIFPATGIALMKRAEKRIQKARRAFMPPLNEKDFLNILVNTLGLTEGDTVFVHSSIDQVNLAFPFGRVLVLLQSVVGEKGTLLFPTYPRVSSYEFLLHGAIFDVRKTPSFTGVLAEAARRQRNAVRSLHPTKSVCAIGRYAHELTSDHQASPYPYDRCSPYYKIMALKGKIVGIGVSTEVLSFVHCVDDELKQDFPVHPYHERLFEAKCVNYTGQIEVVRTYAHDRCKMNHNTLRYIRTYIQPEICDDLEISKRKFFRAHSEPLFAAMTKLARAGITIYPRSVYSQHTSKAP